MNEMRDVIMFLLLVLGVVGIPMGLYLAFRAAMATIKGMDADAAAKAKPEDGERMAELEQRLAELEERVDFSERVLGQQTEARRLEGGAR
jgi:Tfp pilus assembly protein PilO